MYVYLYAHLLASTVLVGLGALVAVVQVLYVLLPDNTTYFTLPYLVTFLNKSM